MKALGVALLLAAAAPATAASWQCQFNTGARPFTFRLVEDKTFQELGRGEIHSTPLRLVSQSFRKGVRIKTFDHVVEYGARYKLRETQGQATATVSVNGNETLCSRVKPDQPWY
jgi:hypothetical protein